MKNSLTYTNSVGVISTLFINRYDYENSYFKLESKHNDIITRYSVNMENFVLKYSDLISDTHIYGQLNNKKNIIKNSIYYFMDKYNIMIVYHPLFKKNEINCDIHYNGSKYDLFLEFYELLKPYMYKIKVNKTIPRINLLSKQNNQLVTKKFDLKPIKIDLELNYGTGFKFINNNLIKDINIKGKSGIYIFNGEPGGGKTTYIKYLLTQIKKEVIYIPSHMTQILSDPDFIGFIENNKDCVLVIEDADNFIKSREDEYNTTPAISNLLNIGDGILGSCFNIDIILTFNTDIKNIDTALLRKGRLKYRHEFKKLTISDSQRLIDKLKINYKVTEDMTLAEIYNINDENGNIKKVRNKIGF